jgi:hypothetical protein
MSSTLGMPEWWTRLNDQATEQDRTGGALPAGELTVLLSIMGYFWWLVLGGVAQVLFGGLYFGSKTAADLHLSNSGLQLMYVLVGLLMIEVSLGILKLARWVPWAAGLLDIVLGVITGIELAKWINGANITAEVVFFTFLNILFVLYNAYFLLSPGVRWALQHTPARGERSSPDLVMCAVDLGLAALSAAILVNYVDKNLSTPVLGLIYLLGGVLITLMAFGTLKLQTWTWLIGWALAGLLTALSVDIMVRRATGGSVSSGALTVSIVSVFFVVDAVTYLVWPDVRRAFIHVRIKRPALSPSIITGGLLLAVFALALSLLPDALGTQAVAYAVPGLVVGSVVGALPGENPVARLMGFVVGLFLADASYLARGGLLPYTNLATALVVLALLATITGIGALFASRTWFVSMLLGAGTLYGLVELQFSLAPSAYLASSGLALISILCSFGVGYMVSSFLGINFGPAPHADAPSPDGDVAKQPAGPAIVPVPAPPPVTPAPGGDVAKQPAAPAIVPGASTGTPVEAHQTGGRQAGADTQGKSPEGLA